MTTLTFEITERIGILNSFKNGWKKEINKVSWNGGEAKFDIREWDREHLRMSRGITLKAEEMKALLDSMEGRL